MTTTRTSTGLAVFCATVLLITACDRSDRTSRFPLSASPTVTPAPTPTATVTTGTLSGVVFEVTAAGNAPVEGVQVYCDACGEGHADSFTDSDGAYRFTDVKTAIYPLWVAKQGYSLANRTGLAGAGWMGSINVTVDRDTRFDIEIIRQ